HCMLTPEQRDALIQAACEIRRQAYCKYSKFQVGAALLTAGGNIYVGCNVENISYGLTNCAERTAIFTAVAAGEGKTGKKNNWVAMAVAAKIDITPCGACRQVIAEFAPNLPLLLINTKKLGRPNAVVETDVAKLLPGRFESLK